MAIKSTQDTGDSGERIIIGIFFVLLVKITGELDVIEVSNRNYDKYFDPHLF